MSAWTSWLFVQSHEGFACNRDYVLNAAFPSACCVLKVWTHIFLPPLQQQAKCPYFSTFRTSSPVGWTIPVTTKLWPSLPQFKHILPFPRFVPTSLVPTLTSYSVLPFEWLAHVQTLPIPSFREVFITSSNFFFHSIAGNCSIYWSRKLSSKDSPKLQCRAFSKSDHKLVHGEQFHTSWPPRMRITSFLGLRFYYASYSNYRENSEN